MASIESVKLSDSNWQEAVRLAVEALPTDLRTSIGYDIQSCDTAAVIVALEPIDEDDGETYVARIDLRYCQTLREQGWPQEFDEFYREGGQFAHQVECPTIVIESPATGVTHSMFPGRATVGDFIKQIQEAILDEFFEGGGFSMISKDIQGRYVRDDGSVIFPDWPATPDYRFDDDEPELE